MFENEIHSAQAEVSAWTARQERAAQRYEQSQLEGFEMYAREWMRRNVESRDHEQAVWQVELQRYSSCEEMASQQMQLQARIAIQNVEQNLQSRTKKRR